MKLSKLTLHNFKGIKEFTLDANGQDVTIFGDNATGKTTICDSLYWLLFDKDSHFKSQFDIKTLDKKGDAKHGLNHEVEGIFITDAGTISLKKSYQEKWTKKRGEAKKTFTGHTTEYFIDGVPSKKKEYTERASKIFDEETFKLLTTPTYFAETLPWKERREILLKVCGDISDDDVIKSDKELRDLKYILKDKSIEDHKKIIAQKRAEINKEIEKIPIRIDEVQRGLTDTNDIEITVERSEVKAIKKQISDLEKQISRIESGGEVAEKTKQLREIEGQLLEIKNTYAAKNDELIKNQREIVYNTQSKHEDCTTAILKIEKEISSLDFEIQRLNKLTSEKRQEYYEINAEQFVNPPTQTTCYACGQDIPESKIEETKQKALSEFNLSKSNRLEQINKDGMQLKRELENKQAVMQCKQDELIGLQNDEKVKFDVFSGAKKILDEMLKLESTYQNDPEYKKLNNKGAEIVKEIHDLENGSLEEVSKIKLKIEDLQKALLQSEMKILDYENSINGQDRIKELESQEKELAQKFEEIEQELFLIESFTRKKVEMLDKKINSRFKLAKFKLFKEQINEGLQECCEVTFNGVPFNSGLNNGARVNVGLDIIKTLSEHFGVSAPIFIDNAEAVTDIQAPEDSQLIKMVVSEPDKNLRVEIENKDVKKAA